MEITTAENIMTVKLTGELDHHSAAPAREKVDTELVRQKPDGLVIDFSGITFMDSSGVGFVMGRYKKASQNNCRLTVTGLSERDKKMMKLSGIEKLAEIR